MLIELPGGFTQRDWLKGTGPGISRVGARIHELEALGVEIEHGWRKPWRLYSLKKGTKTKARAILAGLKRKRLAREEAYRANHR
jgi:hypothetical protein